MEDNSFMMVVQHNPFVVVYRHLIKPLKTQGTQVEAGEAIGMMDGTKDLELEIWDAGQWINPEEVIVW
jgi:septal ring factor EnvC (AmiA/AmiB activator)